MRRRQLTKARSARGGALIIALLVVLVLTIVGLAVAYFTQLEDQTSGNIRLSKTAFYSAETGLRTGERALTTANQSGISAQTLITYADKPSIPLPGGGFKGVPLVVNTVEYDKVKLTSAKGTTDIAVFSLYVRNNTEDPGSATEPQTDTDGILNLISIGQVYSDGGTDAGGAPILGRLLATKVLEEQIVLAAGAELNAQEGQNQGGTGTGQLGK